MIKLYNFKRCLYYGNSLPSQSSAPRSALARRCTPPFRLHLRSRLAVACNSPRRSVSLHSSLPYRQATTLVLLCMLALPGAPDASGVLRPLGEGKSKSAQRYAALQLKSFAEELPDMAQTAPES
jgi:hypothetical protein